MINRSIPPQIHDAVSFEFNLQEAEKINCNNGIKIHTIKSGSQEVIEITLVFKAGLWQENQTAVAQSVASLLKNGTSKQSALEISEAVEYYGASLKTSANNDWSFVSLFCLSKHVSAILPTLFEIVTEASFPESEVAIYKQNALQRLSVNLRQGDFVANRNIDALVFGSKHPYGKYTQSEDIEALTPEVIRAFHRNHYHAGNCQIFVAGNYETDTISEIQEHFGNISWGQMCPIESPQHSLSAHPEKHLRIENDPNSVQGAVRMARPIPRRTDPIFPELFVMNTIFGGYFGSRLMTNIREEKGYTYGIYSSLFSYQHAGVMMIGTEAGKEVCEATKEEVIHEMQIMRDTLVDEEELLLVKNYLLGSILGDLDGPFSILQRWKNLILNEQDEKAFYHSIDVYKTITTERVQELAKEYLQPDAFYDLIVY